MGNKLKFLFFFLTAFTFLSGNISAEEFRQTQRDYNVFIFSPFAGGYVFQSHQRFGLNNANFELNDTYSLGMRLGYGLSRFFDIETTVNFVPSSHNTGDVNIYLYHADAVFNVLNNGRFAPYLDFGAGATTFSPASGMGDTFALITYAAGIKVFLLENLALRADLRGYTKFDSTFTNFNYTLGFSYIFGFTGQNRDSDKDGIVDKYDLCPNEAEDYEGYLDYDGCPESGDKVDPLKGLCEEKVK